MPSMNSGDGSNAPVTQVTELLSQHYAADGSVETPQEEEAETLEASEQESAPETTEPEGESPAVEEEEGEQEPVAASDDGEIKTLAEFAEALEIDPGDLYNLTYAMPDGMEPATLSEMKDAYVQAKKEGGVSESEAAQALQAERQQFEAQVQQTYQQLQAQTQIPPQLQQLDANLNNVIQTIENTKWDELEKVDPGDAALQRQKLNEAYQNMMYQRQNMLGAMQQTQQQQMAILLFYIMRVMKLTLILMLLV